MSIVVAGGCMGASEAKRESQPDVEAIVTVVEAIYGEPERRTTVFLHAKSFEDPIPAETRDRLASELQTAIRPLSERQLDDSLPPFTPVDPETGEPAVTIALGRFRVEPFDQLRVTASFIRDAGNDRGCRGFLLAHVGTGWVVIESSDARPDCPLAEEVLDN